MAHDTMVIRARVRARLLGLHLLTLDAHVTAATQDRPRIALAVSGQPGIPAGGPGRAVRSAGPAPGSAVARARELVAQGALALDQSRRPGGDRASPG